MIDLHNHVLPGVDDGPGNLVVSLNMLDIAVGQGITHVACTSHANDRSGEPTERFFQSTFSRLREAVATEQIPVELALGSELMVGPNILQTLRYPFATYHGRGLYFLIEFPVETPYEIILNVVKSARRQQLWPVLAHFERFSRAQREPEQPAELRREGAVITLDAGSLIGQFGSVIQKRARQLLSWNVVDILASDAHDDAGHGFCLRAGRDAAAEIVGEERAREMVLDNPRRVWESLPWKESGDREEESTP